MKQTRIFYFLLVCLKIAILGCSNSKDKTESNDIEDTTSIINIDTLEATEIIRQIYNKNPEYVAVKNINRKTVIFCVFKEDVLMLGYSTINVLENFADVWQETKEVKLEYGNRIENFDWLKIQNKDFLYFDFNIPGGSMGNGDIVFGLYDYSENKCYKLQFSGMYNGDQIEGEFWKFDSLKKYPDILYALELKAKSSAKIYRPTKEDLDIDNPINAEDKFLFLNPNLHEKLKKNRDEYYKIEVPEYTGIYALFFHENLKNEYSKFLNTVMCEASNDYYSVYSLYKSYIVGLNKRENKFFIVWFPFSRYDFVDKLYLSTDNFLILYDRMDESKEFLIDLNAMQIKCISNKEY